jgi:hypothetical protein
MLTTSTLKFMEIGWSSSWWALPKAKAPDYPSRFEYVDIYVQKMANLNRHMDTKNDCRPGYDYGASYSRLVLDDKDLYRVNFIMTYRTNCGSSVSKNINRAL